MVVVDVVFVLITDVLHAGLLCVITRALEKTKNPLQTGAHGASKGLSWW